MATQSKKRAVIVIGLLALIFLGPFFFALYVYKARPAWLHGSVNHGELIMSPADFTKIAPSDAWTGQWILLELMPLPCNQTCEANLFKVQQVYKTFLDADQKRMVLVVGSFSGQLSPEISKKYPLYKHVHLDQTIFNQSLQGLPQTGLYIVDPHNNVIMVFSNDAAPRDIKKDVTKLLKVSQIG
jgi:hypothetical protein